MHTLAGWRKSSSETWRMRKNKCQTNLMILNLSLGITSLLLKLTKLLGNHLQEKQKNPSLQLFRKVNKIRKRHGTSVFNFWYQQSFLRMLYSLGSGKSMGNIMTNPWAIWMCTRPSGERSCTLTTLQALISFGKEYDENLFESKKKLISSQTTDSSTIDLQYCTRTKNLEKYVVK